MKKLSALLLVVVLLVLSLTACGEPALERGAVSGDTYINASANITFTKKSSWRFYSDSEIAEMMNITVENFMDKDLINSDDMESLIDFMAVEDKTGNNINMTMENLKASGNKNMTEEEYIENAKKMLKQQLTGSNMTYTFGETEQATLGGNEFVRLSAVCKYSGATMRQYIYVRKIGHHMINITITSVDGTAISAFEAMFS